MLKSLGVKRGTASHHLPLVPELAIAMLACARVGAAHSTSSGFSAESLRGRINDASARLLITADGGYRRGQVVPRSRVADEAVEGSPSIKRHDRPQASPVPRSEPHAPAAETSPFGQRARLPRAWAEKALPPVSQRPRTPRIWLYDPLHVGDDGQAQGISMHSTGGYLTGTCVTTKWVFDLKEEDVYWCTADIGWVTGHSYVVYGPLANGATVVMYEGAPDWPRKDRMWEIVERYGVTIFYTAPTAIRAFMRWGTDWPARRDLSSLRLLGSVGEPINPEAWIWYHLHIGRERCPIVDTWWQTETGMILITALPGSPPQAGLGNPSLPGDQGGDRTQDGEAVTVGGGLLALARPWPAMLRGIYGDPERYVQRILEQVGPRHLLHRRWSQARCRRLFLAPGARGRCD